MDNRFTFRAWNEERKEMLCAVTLHEMCVLNCGYGLDNSLVIEQCTGLPAASSYRGTKPEDLLIFEGDKVCALHRETIAEIVWADGAWYLKFDSPSLYNELLHLFNHKCVIIGTVHDEQKAGELGG